jgi:predicted metalloprotease
MMELKADCLAGARVTTIYCETRLEPSDVEEAVFLLSNIGGKPRSPSYAPNARGADQQRIDAL